MHPGTDHSVTQPGKSVNKWSGDASLLNSTFTRISKPLAGISPTSRPNSQESIPSGRNLKDSSHMDPGYSL